MLPPKTAFKREGPPTIAGKKINQFGVVQFVLVRISLDGMPDRKWIRLFENKSENNPINYMRVNSAVCEASIEGSQITFESKEADVNSNVTLIDGYIEKVNERYNSES